MDLLRPLAIFATLAGAGCSSVPEAPSPGAFRAATYNIQWLAQPLHPERKARLQKILGEVKPDILALQEVEGSRVVKEVLGEGWSLALLDSAEDQETALAVRSPFRIARFGMKYRGREHESAFPNDRDLLRVEVLAPGGAKLVVFVVHLKSRRGGRVETDPRRMEAARLIAAAVKEEGQNSVLVMGDFNDTPDDLSVNELEREAGLVNLTEPLYRQDFVTVDLTKFRGANRLSQPRIRGARDENESFRGRKVNYERDVRIKPVLFDQILASRPLAQAVQGGAVIHWTSDILEGQGAGGNSDPSQATRASDHLPVYADFKLP